MRENERKTGRGRVREELVCGGCHGAIPRLRRLPAPFAQPWTTRARPLIFHPVTPINLTAVSESPLWRYPMALSLSFWLSIRYPSATSDSSRCHFRLSDSDVRLLNTRRRLRERPDARGVAGRPVELRAASKNLDLT